MRMMFTNINDGREIKIIVSDGFIENEVDGVFFTFSEKEVAFFCSSDNNYMTCVQELVDGYDDESSEEIRATIEKSKTILLRSKDFRQSMIKYFFS